MKQEQLPYQQTGYFSGLIAAYLEGSEALKPYYNYPSKIESFQALIDERGQLEIDRKILTVAIEEQYEGFEVDGVTKQQLKKLKKNNCFTVTTGHQLNLFTGPLYFIYKIISTIKLAQELKAHYPQYDFVPVYWMATEDHDFEEANHFNLLNERYELNNTKKGAVGQMKLEGVGAMFKRMQEKLGDRNGSKEMLELFSTYYKEDNTYAESIKGLVQHLFGKHGLIIVDGDDRALKSLFINEFKNELLGQHNFDCIKESADNLKEIGFKAQITPREINLFYLREGLRERIVLEKEIYKVLNTDIQYSRLEILEEVANFPERFSPNAPMRCMFQEKILPNLAYIGGGGELAYWLQLKSMFAANAISYPILVLRNSVLILDQGSEKRLSKLGLIATDLFNDTESIIKQYLKNGAAKDLDLSSESNQITSIYEGIVQKATEVDPSLTALVKAEMQRNLKSIKNVESKLLKATKYKEEVAVNQIRNIKDKLFPNGSLQERHDNLSSFLLFYGEEIIEELLEKLHPLDQQFDILTIE